MTKQINMHEAKSRLSELGELVWQGERVIIAKAGKPYLDLLPYKDTRKHYPNPHPVWYRFPTP